MAPCVLLIMASMSPVSHIHQSCDNVSCECEATRGWSYFWYDACEPVSDQLEHRYHRGGLIILNMLFSGDLIASPILRPSMIKNTLMSRECASSWGPLLHAVVNCIVCGIIDTLNDTWPPFTQL